MLHEVRKAFSAQCPLTRTDGSWRTCIDWKKYSNHGQNIIRFQQWLKTTSTIHEGERFSNFSTWFVLHLNYWGAHCVEDVHTYTKSAEIRIMVNTFDTICRKEQTRFLRVQFATKKGMPPNKSIARFQHIHWYQHRFKPKAEEFKNAYHATRNSDQAVSFCNR